MNHREYLARLTDDAAALHATIVSADPDTAVPSCPDWTLDDLAFHVAEVYQHEIAAMRTGNRPDPWPPEPRPATWTAPSSQFLKTSTIELLGELSSHDPAQPCWTWYDQDQTVGFWARRMAQETVIHRWDAENAVGRPEPIDDAVAVDGIDEILLAFLSGDWSDDRQPGPYGIIDVVTGSDRWRVELSEGSVTTHHRSTSAASSARPDAEIRGGAADLLLGLWDRRPLPQLSGDLDLIDALQRRLTLVRQ